MESQLVTKECTIKKHIRKKSLHSLFVVSCLQGLGTFVGRLRIWGWGGGTGVTSVWVTRGL